MNSDFHIDLSIIIVNWNTKNLLKKCIESVYLQELSPYRFEVILVDNGSEDGSVEMTKTLFPQVNIIQNTVNYGFAKANNQAIAICRGRNILLLNTDITFIDKNALQKMVEFLDSYSDTAAVCGKYQFPDGSFQKLYNRFPTMFSVLCLESPLSRFKFVRNASSVRYYHMMDVNFDRDRLVLQPWFACIMIKKDVLNRIGFMDEIFPLYYNDVDMCYRMYNAGMKIYYLSSIRVLHSLGASCAKWGNIRSAEYYSSLIRFFKKHKGKVSTFFIQLIILSTLIFEKLLDAVRPVFKRPVRTGYSLNDIPEIVSSRFSMFKIENKG